MAGGRGGNFGTTEGGAGGTGYEGDPDGRGGNGRADTTMAAAATSNQPTYGSLAAFNFDTISIFP